MGEDSTTHDTPADPLRPLPPARVWLRGGDDSWSDSQTYPDDIEYGRVLALIRLPAVRRLLKAANVYREADKIYHNLASGQDTLKVCEDFEAAQVDLLREARGTEEFEL